eukprot:3879428-Lingulodinium_polyedra.AAC.1
MDAIPHSVLVNVTPCTANLRLTTHASHHTALLNVDSCTAEFCMTMHASIEASQCELMTLALKFMHSSMWQLMHFSM